MGPTLKEHRRKWYMQYVLSKVMQGSDGKKTGRIFQLPESACSQIYKLRVTITVKCSSQEQKARGVTVKDVARCTALDACFAGII
jgi:hypothetical protein